MTQEHFNVDELEFNSKNFVGWIELFRDIGDFPPWLNEKLDAYIKRTDIVRRRKELEDIFGW